MVEAIVVVVFTAGIGGVVVPVVKAQIDGRRERFDVASDLLETLAASLWTYWKLAMRVAYYGSKGQPFKEDYNAALKAWDSDEAWDNGGKIQIQVSQSKRLLPERHEDLDGAQRTVVDDLDKRVDDLRKRDDPTEWGKFYECLMGPKRDEIHELLYWLTDQVELAKRGWLRRWLSGKPPAPPRPYQPRSKAGRNGTPGIVDQVPPVPVSSLGSMTRTGVSREQVSAAQDIGGGGCALSSRRSRRTSSR
jgi:hypothetical protein